MRRIELGDFLIIAEIHTGIAAKQLASMPDVIRLAETALAAPFAGFGDYEMFPALHEKAAIYCTRIVAYHALPDGNKRTAYNVMWEFLARNGATFTHADDDLMGTAQMIEDLAAKLVPEKDFIAWVLERIS
jgi:death-on-curing protein